MKPRVYLQKHLGEFVAPSVFTAYEGFRFTGYDCVGFEEPELAALDLTPETPVVGWVRTVQAALRQLDVPVPPPIDYPEALRPWFGRTIEATTLGALRSNKACNLFVKPVEHKLFTGFTVGDLHDWEEAKDFSDDTPVWRSGLVEFDSEWRCFVREGRLVGIRHYFGDPWCLPQREAVRNMIRAWDDAPVGCAIDVGVTPAGDTVLVEVNDGFALGDYGLPTLTYFELIRSRWGQMVGRTNGLE